MNNRDRRFYNVLGTIGLLFGGYLFFVDIKANGEPTDLFAMFFIFLGTYVLIATPSKDPESSTQNHIEMRHYPSPNVIVKPFSVVETIQNPTATKNSFCGKCGTKFEPDSLDIFCTSCGNSRETIE